jgi:predicted lipoprotein with Yx(FWY)xxD motif
VAQMKRTVIAVSAMIALTACAPAGYEGANSGAAEPVAVAAAEPTVTADPEASAEPGASASPGAAAENDVPLPDGVELTESLTGKKFDRMGSAVVNQDGFLLYRFDRDTNDPPSSNCDGDCAEVWPPALTDGNPRLKGVSDDAVGTISREDGTRQITLDGWPLYTYIGDKKAGQWKGQGVGGTWFVIQPNGKKNLECMPTGTPKAVEPPAGSY